MIFFIKIKRKKSQNSRNQGFFYYFCLMIVGSGSMPLTNGSGSRRPKNIRIRRIRIRNTVHSSHWELWRFTIKPIKDYPGEVNGLNVSNANTVQIAILLSYCHRMRILLLIKVMESATNGLKTVQGSVFSLQGLHCERPQHHSTAMFFELLRLLNLTLMRIEIQLFNLMRIRI
jgi:hypothetical protein